MPKKIQVQMTQDLPQLLTLLPPPLLLLPASLHGHSAAAAKVSILELRYRGYLPAAAAAIPT
jgi:hypothetical protein